MDAATRLHTALRLLAMDPALGGMVIRARVGSVYADALAMIDGLPLPKRRLHPAMGADALDGAVDVTASLAEGTLTRTKGLLQGDPRTLILPMAERAEPLLISRLCAGLDSHSGHILIALDEGAEAEESCPPALSDRLAFHIDLDAVPMGSLTGETGSNTAETAPKASYPADLPEQLITLCVTLGISSLRAASHALRAAQAYAALNQRDRVKNEDIETAVILTLAPRATRLPTPEPEQPDQSEEPSDEPPPETQSFTLPDEILLEAVKAALPPDLLASLTNGTARTATGNGSGRKRIGNRRGRPLPPRGLRAANGARVDMMATLRAAVPWQTLRRAAQPQRTGPIILPSDLRHKRYQELSDRLLIFTVDASGSAALARLAEAKGAVELLLAQAYARRDHVTLIAFRGDTAETLLPPTRSLVQTKRRLADLPGGGATPLAAGLQEAAQAARTAQQKGLTPTIVLLTDGRANIALDGTPDRTQAALDATRMATLARDTGADAIVIDTGNRPEHALQALSAALGGSYLSLPRADAQKLSDSVQRRLDG